MKSATHQFIEDAKAGGWKTTNAVPYDDRFEILLDPLAWQAVGKTRGWKCPEGEHKAELCGFRWRYEWHRFIDHLADGKSIEEALAAIQDGV